MLRLQRKYLTLALLFGQVIARQQSTFLAVENKRSACFYDEFFPRRSQTSSCAMRCYLDRDCVSASVNPDEGRCQLNKQLSCSTFPDTTRGWRLLRKTGDISCNTTAGYRYVAGIQACLKLYNTSVSPKAASVICNSNGGRLMRITSPKHADIVAHYLDATDADVQKVAIDGFGSKEHVNKTWSWHGGCETQMGFTNWAPGETQMGFTNWAPGEPQPRGNWRCIVLRPPLWYRWHSEICYRDHGFAYLCETPIGE